MLLIVGAPGGFTVKVAVLLVPLVMGLAWGCGPLLEAFGIDAAVRAQAVPYMRALNWSSLPLLLYLREAAMEELTPEA